MKGGIWEFFFPRKSAERIGQEKWVIYMKTNIHFLSYLAHFFLEWKILQTNVVEKLETHILRPFFFFRKSWRLWGYKYTHRLCNTQCFPSTTMVAWTRLNVTLYVHCLSCSVLFSDGLQLFYLRTVYYTISSEKMPAHNFTLHHITNIT
jgi:hypothetical protein